MKKIILIIALLIFLVSNNFAQDLKERTQKLKDTIKERFAEVDSIRIKDYEKKLDELKQMLNKRLQELMNNDNACNQINGAIAILNQLIDEEKNRIKKNVK